MTLQALLVSKDDRAAETLAQVFAQLDVVVVRLSAAEVAVSRLSEDRFDLVFADFEDQESATLMLEGCRRLAAEDRSPQVTVALLTEAQQVRSILGMGAHFILKKPVHREQALATLRAATAILTRERRRELRVAVQLPVSIHEAEEQVIEGIMLDLSTGGMDVLAAKPVKNASLVRISFDLPDGGPHIEAEAEVVWSTVNSQLGLRFLDVEPKVREQLAEWLKSQLAAQPTEDPNSLIPCKLTDMSLGGCYVETESPFPQSSALDLCLQSGEMKVQTEGLVRVMHPGYGMGIEFPNRTEQQRQSVCEFIQGLTSQPGAQPQLQTSPRSLVAPSGDPSQGNAQSSESEDPLLELLRAGSGMDQEEFLAELRRQRTPANAAP